MTLIAALVRRSTLAARQAVSQRSAALMSSQVRITRGPDAVLDEFFGSLELDGADIVYEGPARLGAATGPVTYTVGEEVQFFSSSKCTVPTEADGEPVAVQIDDLLLVTAHEDPDWVGRRFRVVDVEANGLLGGGRTLQIIGVARYAGWVDDAVRHPAVGGAPDEIPPGWHL